MFKFIFLQLLHSKRNKIAKNNENNSIPSVGSTNLSSRRSNVRIAFDWIVISSLSWPS